MSNVNADAPKEKGIQNSNFEFSIFRVCVILHCTVLSVLVLYTVCANHKHSLAEVLQNEKMSTV